MWWCSDEGLEKKISWYETSKIIGLNFLCPLVQEKIRDLLKKIKLDNKNKENITLFKTRHKSVEK